MSAHSRWRVWRVLLRRSVATVAGLAVASPVLAWAEPQAESGWGMPRDVSLEGHRIEWLIKFGISGMVIAFVAMCLWMFIACVKHTAKRKHRAHYTHGTSLRVKVGGLAIAFGVFFCVDGMLYFNSAMDMEGVFMNFDKPLSNPNAVRIEINAHQWAWDARYPGPDREFNTADDIVTLNDIRIPIDTPVVFQLAAVDVIHSFYLPNFRFKLDAIPGTVNAMWIQAVETGEFDIACAQHCGTGHYKMRGRLTVMKKGDYAAWRERSSAIAVKGFDSADKDAQWGWPWQEL